MKSQNIVEEDEVKYNQIEKLITMPKDENILYCTASDDDLYILTDRNKLLIYEKYTKSNIYSQINVMQTIIKKEAKLQSRENLTKIWCNKTGDHVIIRKDKSVFYYNPYCKSDFNLKEINLEYNSKYYVEPYSIAFNEELKSKDEFEILVTDYFSEIYNLKIKINNKNEIIINSFEKVFSFKTKFELEQEKITEEKLNENKNEIKTESDNTEINFDLDFDPMELINFGKNERIIDIQIYNDEKNKEKIIIACTKNMIFKFSGKESTFKEIFLKYSTNSELILKSYRNFPSKSSSENININNTHLQILSSYTNDSINELVFGCKGSYGYCLGKINSEENSNDNMFIIQSHKPKYLGEKKIPLFTLDEDEKKNNEGLILICQSKLHLFYLYENCLLMMNKLTMQYVNAYMLSSKFKNVFYMENNNNIFLYNENEILKISCQDEDKNVWSNYIQIQNYDLALKTIPNTNIELKSKVHKLFSEFYFNQKKYELAGKEYALSNENFEHVCYKFLRQGNIEGLIIYLKMIKDYKLNDKNNQAINNELFINKYLVYTWLSTLLINEEKNEKMKKKLEEYGLGKFWSEFNSYQKDKYLNRQSIYRYLKINRNEKELNDFATLKNDHKIIIQNLLFKGKYEEAFNYIEKTLGNGKDNIEECIKTFMKYFDLFISKSVKNTVTLLDNISFTIKEQRLLVNALMEIDYKKYAIEEDEKNFNIILNYLKKIIYENITSNIQNKNLNNFYLLFLSLSKKDESKKEIINYLKSPLNTYILKDNKITTNFSNKKVLIDLNFAEKILQDIPQALSLIYFYMKKYEKSINILLEKEDDELAIQIAQNIKNEEKKKKIWMKLFKEYKKNKKFTSKEILVLAGGSLKIEDILQSLDSEVKLKEIKNDLQSCIDVYEQGVTSIKQNIISFNKSNNSIQEDIFHMKKRKFELNHSNIKCRKCGNIITDNKFFLYPCGHIFDVDCSVKILIDYENKNISNGELKSRVKAVKNLSTKIMNMQKKKTEERKSIIMGGLSEIGKKTKGAMKRLITFVKKEEKKSIWDEKEDDKDEVELSREEEIQLKELSNGLYDLLKSECVLCGQEMINSTQNMFSQNNEDKWGNLVE